MPAMPHRLRKTCRFGGLVLLLLLVAVSRFADAGAPARAPASIHGRRSPEQARKEFRVAPGLRVELVAAEPDIQSPVAMAFDEDGKLWVVEMRDYPNGPGRGKPPEGRIVILEDQGGSGRYRRSRVFAEGLLFAQGLMPWRGGVIVTCAPDILHLGDRRRKGKADRREVLYEGFATGNPQLRVNHPVLGLDNRVYVANGLRGGLIGRPGRPAAERVSVNGFDFRFDPIHLDRYEPVTGMGQYGNTFDDWGRRFVCTNRNQLIPIILPNRYVKRNPFLAPPEPVRDNQDPGGADRVYPLSANFTTASYHAGTFTAACGVSIYRGSLLPAAYRGSAFTCEPTGNLVHQEVLTPRGAGFRHRPARKGVEFLATPDDWCRPVNLADGPDGALYVVDMYRVVIEHPEWMPPELKGRPDLLSGKDRGRIWRVAPEAYHGKPLRPHLSTAKTPGLVALLENPDGWWRTTAQRLLLERRDPRAAAPLRKLVLSSRQPLARAHAAWLLQALGALDPKLVAHLLKDPEPRVREQAVRLSEPWLGREAVLQERVTALAGDADARLRFQVALSLGEWDDDRILTPLARIALVGADDHWTRMAVASAVPRRAGALIAALCRLGPGLTGRPSAGRLVLLRELAALVGGRREPAEVAAVLAALAKLPGQGRVRWQMAGLGGLAEGMGRRGTQLAAFLAALPQAHRAVARQATALLSEAAAVATDRGRPRSDRGAALGLLAHAPWPAAGPALMGLVQSEPAQELRLAAVRALAAHPRPEVARFLLEGWGSYTPALRREVTETMLRQPDRIRAFLDAVQAGRIKAGDLDAQRRQQLVHDPRPDIRQRARKLLRGSRPADRRRVLRRYQAALKLKGDTARGKVVFRKNCATCHRVAGIGVAVGPEISDTLGKTPGQILNDILDPNAAIDSNYINYVITTKDGKILTGIITAETASSLTLKRPENQTDVVLRQDIDDIQSTGKSLMPEGLEKTISVQDMADLLTFLKHWRYQANGVPAGRGGR
jgi:putative membrane-bound dehydrogenase-like protein